MRPEHLRIEPTVFGQLFAGQMIRLVPLAAGSFKRRVDEPKTHEAQGIFRFSLPLRSCQQCCGSSRNESQMKCYYQNWLSSDAVCRGMRE